MRPKGPERLGEARRCINQVKCDFKFETPSEERLEFVKIGDTVACRVRSIYRVRTWREAQKSLVTLAVNHKVSSFRVMPCNILYLRRSRNAFDGASILEYPSNTMQPMPLVDASVACDHHLPRAN